MDLNIKIEKRQRTELGKLIVQLIKAKKMTQCKFYEKLGISKPFFYDILAGAEAPNIEMQYRMLDILEPKEKEREKFFDLCAIQRNDIPADIYNYIKENPSKHSKLRKMIYEL